MGNILETKPADKPAQFNRAGVSDKFLTLAGCHHVGADQCVDLYGCRAEGIAIPFRSLDGQPIVDNEKPFARIRLYAATDSQKYHQRSGSQPHIYIPPNFRELSRGSTLYITEGEFKAMSLAESGFAAIGLCGINGAMRDGELHPELVAVLEFHKPARVAFIGDSDTVLNSDFAREVAKLRKALFESKRFSFIQDLASELNEQINSDHEWLRALAPFPSLGIGTLTLTAEPHHETSLRRCQKNAGSRVSGTRCGQPCRRVSL